MALLTDSWFYDLLTIIIICVSFIIYYIKRSQNYWKRKGVVHPEPEFFFGNMKKVFYQKESVCDNVKDQYNFFKSRNVPYGGVYFLFVPVFQVIDLDIVKHVIQNDFQHFVNRGIYYNETTDPLSAHLFAIDGEKWKHLRAKLTPTFTSGKLKMMFQTLVDCSKQLTIEMDKTTGILPIDIKDILGRFTTDIIGSCAFGIDCNSLKNPETEFRTHGSKFFERNIQENIIAFFTFLIPDFMKLLGTRAIRKPFSDFFFKVIKDTVEYREQNNIIRKDFMHLLLQLKNHGQLIDDPIQVAPNKKSEKETITLNELAAQCFIFFLAGFETSSTTMTFCLYELATNQDIQEKLRQEIEEVLKKYDGEITYNAIMEMTYMEKVVNETLRKYPPVPTLNRVCTKEYKVPGSELVLEAESKVIIPVYGIHHDERYYPDPSKFDPERFSEENKRNRHPCTFLPFGEGPRNCIGLRFGMMQTKVGLTALIRHYNFTVSSKTHVPLKMDARSFIMSTEGGVWLDFKKL